MWHVALFVWLVLSVCAVAFIHGATRFNKSSEIIDEVLRQHD